MNEVAMTSKPEEKQSFSFSKENNGVTKTVRGEQVENGWVITIEKEWYTERDDGDGRDWQHESKKFVTTKDPRESMKAKEEETSPITNLLNDMASSSGMLMI